MHYWVKQHVMEAWSGLQLNIVDSAVGEWRKRLPACACERGRRIEHTVIPVVKVIGARGAQPPPAPI